MKKVVVKILQGSVVTQTTLGGLTIHPWVANFLECIFAENYENWLAADKVIAKIIRLVFLAHPVIVPMMRAGDQKIKSVPACHPASRLCRSLYPGRTNTYTQNTTFYYPLTWFSVYE